MTSMAGNTGDKAQSPPRFRRVAVAVLFATVGCADAVLLHPTTGPRPTHGSVRHLVPFDGGELELFYAASPGCDVAPPVAIDLDLVGNGSRAEWSAPAAAERWGRRPVAVWSVNYPGFGGSTGPARLASIVPAALAAYDAVADGRPVVLTGHSLGTAAALAVAARRPVAGVVLLNPTPLRQRIVGTDGWWNLWLLAGPVAAAVPCELDALANGRACRAPAVIVSSGRDRVVPPRYHRLVFDAYAGPERLVPEPTAGHDDFPDPATDAAYRGAIDWLWDRVEPAVQPRPTSTARGRADGYVHP